MKKKNNTSRQIRIKKNPKIQNFLKKKKKRLKILR